MTYMSSYSRASDSMDELKPRMLIGRYMMVREIGYGGYSCVWMAFDVQTSDFCALKICTDEMEENLHREFDLGLLFGNMMVDRMYVSVPHDTFWFKEGREEYFCGVFRLYGGSLTNVFNSQKYSRGLPLMIALRFLSQQLRALQALHELKTLHTDIRPENILVSDMPVEYVQFMETYRAGMRATLQGRSSLNAKLYESLSSSTLDKMNTRISRSTRNGYTYNLGDRSYCVLHDFGLAEDDTEDFRKLGILDYRSPENIMECPVSRAFDVWSLGCVFFHMLTGDHLFNSNNLDEGPKEERMLQLMFAVVGYPPDAVIASSPRCKEFFIQKRRKYILSIDHPLPAEQVSLRKLLEKHIPTRLSKRSMDLVVGIMQKLLHSDPAVRKRFNYRSTINEINTFLKSHGHPTSPIRTPRSNQLRDTPPSPTTIQGL